MLYLVLSIICSVSVGVIFKLARRNDTVISQIVAWNYVFALSLCYLFFTPDVTALSSSSPWVIYGALGLLLPTIFLMLATSIRYMGIVKTDAAQRLSLFIPILAAWFIFGEDFNAYKFIGLLVVFPAIVLILSKPDSNNANKWHYPALVLLGFGVIDVLFKQVIGLDVPYTTSLFTVFCIALPVAFCIAIYQVVAKGKTISLMNFAFGALVGIFNFGNILFYLLAHKEFSENPSTVFAGMNMGVIVVGSLTGIFFFKEKMTARNYLGIALALVAIVFITLSQLYK